MKTFPSPLREVLPNEGQKKSHKDKGKKIFIASHEVNFFLSQSIYVENKKEGIFPGGVREGRRNT